MQVPEFMTDRTFVSTLVVLAIIVCAAAVTGHYRDRSRKERAADLQRRAHTKAAYAVYQMDPALRARADSLEAIGSDVDTMWASGADNLLSHLERLQREEASQVIDCPEFVEQWVDSAVADSLCASRGIGHTVERIRGTYQARADNLYAEWLGDGWDRVTSYVAACPHKRWDCDHKPPPLTWNEYRNTQRLSESYVLLHDAPYPGLGRSRLLSFLDAAGDFRDHMRSAGLLTPNAARQIAASEWIAERQAIMRRNQAISDREAAAKRSRSPAQRDSVRQDICRLLQMNDC